MDIGKLEKILQEDGQPKFRLAQIKKAVFQDGVSSFQEISTVPKGLRGFLEKNMDILPFSLEEIKLSKDKLSAKALLKLQDGNFTETVLMPGSSGAFTVCVSSQIGCPLGCAFCATGKGGFERNLTSEEITGQVLFWRQYLKKNGGNISNIVFMGMGEPFLNWENVKKSLRELTDPGLFGFGSRSISVSTAGVSDGISKLAKEFPQVNLAVSLHFADDGRRGEFMPINKKFNLTTLRENLHRYLLKTRRKVMLEYIMLAGENDSLTDAKKLVEYVKSIGRLQLLHVNLISYNRTLGEFSGSSVKTISQFKEYLLKNGISATVRKSLGADISGACGQLAGKRVIG
ncbi:MAG: Radical core protein [Patescibacteria group bacterium]|nr:Radical core protein [Patescibacteria group bacterium]